MMRTDLVARRRSAESAWSGFREGGSAPPRTVSAEVAASWQRSRSRMPQPVAAAPLPRVDDGSAATTEATLQCAAAPGLAALASLALQSDMVVALSDAGGRLLWTASSRIMRGRAERVNFIAGARWDEASIGTNAVSLALTYRHPATVFSAEHYAPAVHDWVCYAAPIIHGGSGQLLGVLDFSTTWTRHTPMALPAVTAFAAEIAGRLPAADAETLTLNMLGTQQAVYLGDQRVALAPRQMEVLCALALHPAGLQLDELHAALYGDAPVCLSTLKAEVSHLRQVLPATIGSRPYRLLRNVTGDFLRAIGAIEQGDGPTLLQELQGVLLPRSEAPCLTEWRNYIEAGMEAAIMACNDTTLLTSLLIRSPAATSAAERLLALLPAGDHRRLAAAARLGAAQ